MATWAGLFVVETRNGGPKIRALPLYSPFSLHYFLALMPTALCVYCGSSSGSHPEYVEQARAFGTEMARRDIALVYGGGKVGLMGTVANAVLAGGGQVIGVIPRQLVELEVAHTGLTEIVVVDTMHQRKTRMYELSDAFV